MADSAIKRRRRWWVAGLAVVAAATATGAAAPRQTAARTDPEVATRPATWLPPHCRLAEIGPASAGYRSCPTPRGMQLPNGYEFVRVGRPPVHTTTGASG